MPLTYIFIVITSLPINLSHNMTNKIIVNSQDHLQFIQKDEIVFCKSDNNYTYIHLKDGSEVLLCKSLSKFSKELGQGAFIRISQSYLISKEYIKKIDKRNKQVYLINEAPIKFTISIKEFLS